MRLLGLAQVSCLLEPLARLEEVARQVGCAQVDAEALDHAPAVDDRAAGLPERATLAGTCLGLTLSDEAERAVLGFDLAHEPSVRRSAATAIGRRTDLRCGLLPKHEDRPRAVFVWRPAPVSRKPPGAGC